jgi:hypothetical protein
MFLHKSHHLQAPRWLSRHDCLSLHIKSSLGLFTTTRADYLACEKSPPNTRGEQSGSKFCCCRLPPPTVVIRVQTSQGGNSHSPSFSQPAALCVHNKARSSAEPPHHDGPTGIDTSCCKCPWHYWNGMLVCPASSSNMA